MSGTHETVRLPVPLKERIAQVAQATGWTKGAVLRLLCLAGAAGLEMEIAGNTSLEAARDSIRNAARWHGSNAMARQLNLLPAELAKKKAAKVRRKK